MSILEFEDLGKSYRTRDGVVAAVAHANATLEPGELVALMGPSGSGKSTLLLLLGLVETPDCGVIRLSGETMVDSGIATCDLRAIRRTRIGYVFQRANLIPLLTALENIALVLDFAGTATRPARERARALLDAMGLARKHDRYPHQLSGGEQQRVAICRALANRPSLICADEPTAALDGARAAQVIETLREFVAANRCAAIISTHDQRLAPYFHRILRIEDGRLLAPDSVDSALAEGPGR